MISFLVLKGFSLLELRKLYLDELIDFHKHTILILEKSGEIKEGTFDKMNGKTDAASVVDQLRRGIAKVRK